MDAGRISLPMASALHSVAPRFKIIQNLTEFAELQFNDNRRMMSAKGYGTGFALPWTATFASSVHTSDALKCSEVKGTWTPSTLYLPMLERSVTDMVHCSGAGKSTVAALLARFYSPQHGDILLNKQRATSFTRGEWARAVSVVQQEPILFGGPFSIQL